MRRRFSNSLRGEPSLGTSGAANNSPEVKPPRCAMLSMLKPEPMTLVPKLMEKPITRLIAAK